MEEDGKMKKLLLILIIGLTAFVRGDVIPIPQAETDPCLAALDINETDVTNWGTAYTHSQDNTQAHSDYLLNTGDTGAGNYSFSNSANAETLTVVGTYSTQTTTPVMSIESDYDRPLLHLNANYSGADTYIIFQVTCDNALDKAFGTYIPSLGAYGPFLFSAVGNMEWGSGSSGRDTKMSRESAGALLLEGVLHTKQTTGTAATTTLLERVGSSDTIYGCGRLLATKSSNMGDGFGGTFNFCIQDDAAVVNPIASFGCVRAGADNSGDFIIYTYASGSSSEKLRIKSDGGMVNLSTYSQAVGGTNQALYIDNTGLIGINTSSRKYKENIRDVEDTTFIYKLKPKIYDRKDNSSKDEIGLIAEEVAEIYSKAVGYKMERIETPIPDSDINKSKVIYIKTNEPESVSYDKLIVPLLAEVQKLNNRVTQLEKEIVELKKK